MTSPVSTSGPSTRITSTTTAPSQRPVVHPGATSYENYKQLGLSAQVLPPGDNGIRAYGDFTGHGRLDLFRAVLTYSVAKPLAQATPSRFEFYSRQDDGTFVLDTTAMPRADGCLHPRKAIVADFNGDQRADVFVACHGYDAEPWPGEKCKVVLSQPNGTYLVQDASDDVGFNHGASAADLNGDGAIDVVVASSLDPERAFVLLNDGRGNFARQAPSRMPASIRNGGPFFSTELVDVDGDGDLDLLLGGHEFDGAPTSIFFNPGTNDFTDVTATVIPAVPGEGVILDFTVTGAVGARVLWVLRTSGGDGTFYQSRVVQRVLLPSMGATLVLDERPAKWIPWIIPSSVNGANVIISDNVADGVLIPQ